LGTQYLIIALAPLSSAPACVFAGAVESTFEISDEGSRTRRPAGSLVAARVSRSGGAKPAAKSARQSGTRQLSNELSTVSP